EPAHGRLQFRVRRWLGAASHDGQHVARRAYRYHRQSVHQPRLEDVSVSGRQGRRRRHRFGRHRKLSKLASQPGNVHFTGWLSFRLRSAVLKSLTRCLAAVALIGLIGCSKSDLNKTLKPLPDQVEKAHAEKDKSKLDSGQVMK